MQAIDTRPELEQLFRDAADDLLRYFSRRHEDARGDVSARDLVQETFAEMAKSLDRGGSPKSPRAYLFGIARKVSLAAWRRQYRDKKLSAAEEKNDGPAAPTTDDRADAAREIIATLPDLHREILDLRFTHDLAYVEIAEALSIPIGTVRSRLHHAIRIVRDRLAEDDPDLFLQS